MTGNDWNRLGRDVKDIVQHAIDTGDFGALNRDLGVTLENALGNVAQSMKNAARNGMGNPGGYRYDQNGMPPFGADPFNQNGPYGTENRYGSNSNNSNNGSHYGGYTYRPYGHYRSSSSQRMRAAREEFALFVNTGGSKAVGITFMVLGIVFASIFGLLGGIFGLVNMVKPVPGMGGGAIGFGIAAAVFAVAGICGNNLRKK